MNVEKLIKTQKEIPIESRTMIHLALVNSKLNENFTNALKPYDVSMEQFNVLRILRGQSGQPANLSTINERMVTKMSNTTRLVDKLMNKGYVNRITCPSNRRKVEITITNKGTETLSILDTVVYDTQSKILDKFSEKDLNQLNRLLDKF